MANSKSRCKGPKFSVPRQARKLLKKFKEMFSGKIDTIKTLQTVVLMTPENLHLNAFMYEPILDMSDDHLKKLYSEVRGLK